MNHTKEPWRVTKVCEANYEISHDHGTNQIEVTATAITKANARRIAACVNACREIDTDTLEDLGQETTLAKMCARLLDQRSEARKQRDELLEIFRRVVNRGIGSSDIAAMRAALARAEGGAA